MNYSSGMFTHLCNGLSCVQWLGCWGEKVPMLGVEIEFDEITTNMQIDINNGDINNEGVGEVVVKVA